MGKRTVTVFVVITISVTLAALFGHAHEAERIDRLENRLINNTSPTITGRVDPGSLNKLPAPVKRYFKHVMTDRQPFIKTAWLQQSGELRTSTESENWLPFTATQIVSPATNGFIWNAKVQLPLATHVRVVDSYIDGTGGGEVSFLSTMAIASESGAAELNAGALHRYLAEAVWYPTALLPRAGVFWSPVDDNTAIATLTNHGTTVSLEFRFNAKDEVTAIFSSGRFGRFDNSYRKLPWQGHFRDYHVRDGMRVPRYGEVGWYRDGKLQLVWKGHLVNARYSFAQ